MKRSMVAGRRWVWTDRLQRFSQGSLTVQEFCEREGVSVPSFYQWRRKLSGSPSEAAATAPRRESGASPGPREFVPVQITQSAGIELCLPNGVRVLLPDGNAVLLAAAIEAAGRLPQTRGQEEAAC